MIPRSDLAQDYVRVLLCLGETETSAHRVAREVELSLTEARACLRWLHRACLANESLPSGRWSLRPEGETVVALIRAAQEIRRPPRTATEGQP